MIKYLLGTIEDLVKPVDVDKVKNTAWRNEHKPDGAKTSGWRCAVYGPDFEPVWWYDKYTNHEEHKRHRQSVDHEGEWALWVSEHIKEPPDKNVEAKSYMYIYLWLGKM